jgi:hypothetical protein
MFQDFEYFRLAKGVAGGVHHFTTYSTISGKKKFIVEDYDEEGNPIKKRFYFDKDRLYQVSKQNEEEIEFLKNHPNNPESPEFSGTLLFERVQPAKEAKERLDVKIKRSKAVNLASELSGSRLLEICALAGAFYNDNQTTEALEYVVAYAEKNPDEFNRLFKSPQSQTKVKYAVTKGRAQGILTADGNGVIKFGQVTLGLDNEQAAAKLMAEGDLLELLLNKIGIEEEKIADEVPITRGKPAAKAKAE